VDQRLVNKKVIESLIQAGSMDSLEGHRAQIFSAIDLAQSWASKAQIRQQSKIEDLFGGINGTESNRTGPLSLNYPLLPETPRWTTHEKLTKEKELVGFYISGHPLSRFEDEILAFSKIRLDEIQSLKEGETVMVCGMINGMRTILDRKGKQMAFVTLEDLWGNIEIVVFSDPFERYRPLIKIDSMIMVRGRINQRGEEKPKLLCEEIYLLENVKESFTKSIGLRIASPQSNDQVLEPVLNILRTNSGLVPVYITYRQSEREEIFMKSKKFQIHPTHELIQQLRQILGKENVWLNG
jgi:DNA polymerase-3 subunit alpha